VKRSSEDEPLSADALLERVKNGEAQAVEPLYRGLWGPVVSYCARQLGGGADAEDAAQGALLKLIDQAHEYETSRSALAWAFALAYWECRTLRTSTQRAARRTVEGAEMNAADPEPLADEKLLDDELRRLAAEALGELSPEEVALLSGSASSLPPELIAMAPASRRKRKQRLLQRVRAAFGELMHPGGKT